MSRLVTVFACLALISPAASCATAPRAESAVVASADPAATVPVTCREMLMGVSNVIVSVCGTAEEWAEHERRSAAAAAAFTRHAQGSPYTGG